MTGDISAYLFDPRQNYTSVRLQQGRVITDVDWNENERIGDHRLRRLLADVVCGYGTTNGGAAMPRSTCSPSGTSGVVVSAATAPEISPDRPSGRHSPSSRLTRFTAGPMAVKSSRSAAPI